MIATILQIQVGEIQLQRGAMTDADAPHTERILIVRQRIVGAGQRARTDALHVATAAGECRIPAQFETGRRYARVRFESDVHSIGIRSNRFRNARVTVASDQSRLVAVAVAELQIVHAVEAFVCALQTECEHVHLDLAARLSDNRPRAVLVGWVVVRPARRVQRSGRRMESTTADCRIVNRQLGRNNSGKV